MSKEASVGLSVAEKFLGLLIIVIGVITVYLTHTNPPTYPVATYSSIFKAAGLTLIVLGIFLILAKTE